MKVSIRKFEKGDIPNKVKWINDPANNTYLHYDLPLEVSKTEAWFDKNQNRDDRYDAVIEADGIPCGLIGLLSIDRKNAKAEYYISMGEQSFKGKGVSTQASHLLLTYAFEKLGLNKIYLYTEADNIPAQKLFEKVGFVREGYMTDDLFSKGKYVDRIAYAVCKADYHGKQIKPFIFNTPIQKLDSISNNTLYIKRDDLIPFSFGGNKARKAALFFDEIDKGHYDCVVTYGSSSSNHCRIVANSAASRNLKCYIISPQEASAPTYNSAMMNLFGAEITVCPTDKVGQTIENKLSELSSLGHKPFFIPGGGHGNTGTQAYVECYDEIKKYEREHHVHFDYIFHASGTGTTQAGLICGKIINGDTGEIVGISIARKNPRGRDVVIDCVKEYLSNNNYNVCEDKIDDSTVFTDEYILDGYGAFDKNITDTIRNVLKKYGIPLDSTYTGKAFAGMYDYLEKNSVTNKNILFIHTGGTPLFFDFLNNSDKLTDE